MIIAIASGKGGTGKTTLATNLAVVAGSGTWLLDCDVEEPNDHIFLAPRVTKCDPVFMTVPEVDADLCTQCGACGAFCQFSAIVALKTKALTFPELCHACGGCALVCPASAIHEEPREIGVVEQGDSRAVRLVTGCMSVGVSLAPPLVRAVRRQAPKEAFVIIDAPPGTACPVVAAVRGTDYAVLVTEPTPFGLHDLRLAVGMMREIRVPFGVVINRANVGDRRVQDFCDEQDIEVLLKLPDDRAVAEAYSRGELIVEALPQYGERFADLLAKLKERAAS